MVVGYFHCPKCGTRSPGDAPTGSYSYICANTSCGQHTTYTLTSPPDLQYFTCSICGIEALDSNFYDEITGFAYMDSDDGVILYFTGVI